MRAARWTLVYRGVDISGDLDPMTTRVTYTDKLHGEADEIEVEVEDKDGLWRGPWCPTPIDRMQLWYAWDNGLPQYAGSFQLDEPEIQIARGGDTMIMRGVATPIDMALRTERTAEYEGQSVRQIAETAAGRVGLTVTGRINETRWRRKTQRRMRDLEFLRELAEDTDHYMSVRGSEVQINAVELIDGALPAAVFETSHRDVLRFSGRFESRDTYRRAETRHYHDEDKRLILGEARDDRVANGDTLKIIERAEDERQAELMARSRLHHANRKRRSGRLALVGRPDLVAGCVVGLGPSFGQWAGLFTVDASRHTLQRGPYVTELTLMEARGSRAPREDEATADEGDRA